MLITVADAADAPADATGDIVPGTALRAESRDAASGAVLVGYGTKEPSMRLSRPAEGRFGGRQRAMAAAPAPATAMTGVRSPVVSPLVRRRALDHGIDPTRLTGSGPGSLVMSRDVDAAIAAKDAEPGADSATAASRSPGCVNSSPLA